MKKILIVEDEMITSLEMRMKIESWGYSVLDNVKSSSDAVETAIKNKPDLIIMDVVLYGNEDGITAAENIQKHVDIPIIYVTAYSSEMIMERAHKTSPYAYIIKPFDDNELKFAIELALKKQELKKEFDEKQELHSIISKNLGDVIWILDLKSAKFNYVSDSVEGLRGYTPDEVLEQSMEDVLTKESYQRIMKALPERIQSILSGDESLKVSKHLVDQTHKNGSKIPTEVVTSFLYNENGEVDRVLGVTRKLELPTK
ncbi:putative PAS/PAC sensor protein [Methanobacterium lacus]|uniref:Putative PAS/PAC sensor protein n=1 Tax=Methanobacterium lacus (strain AL-21) TaxID=877455 RepID=F0T7M4_METLA|nr:response regulator [Methanobacterium lacus]ADZ09592.1 putative PAS/PAC sensor protein [Methanobacterium lacus]